MLVFVLGANAHQDRIFQLHGDVIEGLPEQYQPATFFYENRQLTIENNSVIIPEDIWNQFGDIAKDPLRFAGSWYHPVVERNIFGKELRHSLPPYMSIKNSNLDLLINLDTLEIIETSWNTQLTSNQVSSWNSSITWGSGYPKQSSNQNVVVFLPPIGSVIILFILIIRLFKIGNRRGIQRIAIVENKTKWMLIKTAAFLFFFLLFAVSLKIKNHAFLLTICFAYPIAWAYFCALAEKHAPLINWRRKAIIRIIGATTFEVIFIYFLSTCLIITSWS